MTNLAALCDKYSHTKNGGSASSRLDTVGVLLANDYEVSIYVNEKAPEA